MGAKKLNVEGKVIAIFSEGDDDFFSLTDMLTEEDGNYQIKNWLRTRRTVELLGIWEQLHNPNFNSVEFDLIKKEVGLPTSTLSAKEWIERTNAIGIRAKTGRYGGTYAHMDIATEFASWLSPAFKLYLIKEFQRLKAEENERLVLGWDFKRTLAKINYRLHTDAIKEYLIPEKVSNQIVGYIYSNEADILNKALFGQSAKEWRENNPNLDGNIRDYATAPQLVVLANLESFNAHFIKEGLPNINRLLKLNEIAIQQMTSLSENISIKKLGLAKAPQVKELEK
jgi:hypothetical protein